MPNTYYNTEKPAAVLPFVPSAAAVKTDIQLDPIVKAVTDVVFAPVICDFVGWVLQSALKKEIKRLYFLARDGWIMYNTALVIRKKYDLDIDLKYLCCSRLSLRNAALSDLGEEAYKYLLEGGFALTPKVILGRLRLSGEERQEVYSDIGHDENEDTEMGKAAAAEFCGKLKKSPVYNRYITETSRSCKENASAYLEQEGLLSDVPYALVDSGWTGSMQRMFRILTGKEQIGFYFGLYAKPNDEDGEFNAYLFEKNTSPLLVSRFNNHLFEALCGAPHGMTVGYEKKEDAIYPIFKQEKSLNSDSVLLYTQETELYRYAEENYIFSGEIKNMNERQSFAFPLLDQLMFAPKKEIAERYGELRFSDDPAELYSFPLAAKAEETRRLYLLPRLKEKFFGKGELVRPIYWGYATAVLSGKGSFCRFNLRMWEILWLVKRK